jgi:hypothetical protein
VISDTIKYSDIEVKSVMLSYLAIAGVLIAAICGYRVYRHGQETDSEKPLFRGFMTFILLLISPAAVFYLGALVLTSELPVLVAALPIALLGVGTYIIASGHISINFNSLKT